MELHITKKGDKKINLKKQKPQNNNHAIDIHVHFDLLGQLTVGFTVTRYISKKSNYNFKHTSIFKKKYTCKYHE